MICTYWSVSTELDILRKLEWNESADYLQYCSHTLNSTLLVRTLTHTLLDLENHLRRRSSLRRPSFVTLPLNCFFFAHAPFLLRFLHNNPIDRALPSRVVSARRLWAGSLGFEALCTLLRLSFARPRWHASKPEHVRQPNLLCPQRRAAWHRRPFQSLVHWKCIWLDWSKRINGLETHHERFLYFETSFTLKWSLWPK